MIDTTDKNENLASGSIVRGHESGSITNVLTHNAK
jgi:hypothetical protein